jgi:hypothetical protein
MKECCINALATVREVNVGAANCKGCDGDASAADQIVTIEAIEKQCTAEATGIASIYIRYVPATA